MQSGKMKMQIILHLSRLSGFGYDVTVVTVGCVASVTTYKTECQDVMT